MRRVLVVDDEENLRLVLRTLLRRHGYEVETAPTGEEALALVDSFGPDVVLTDVRMPKMGGLDLLTTLKAKGNEATVIVMSAYGNMDMAVEAMKAGAYDYVQKPFKPDEVVLALKKAEERESLRRENRALRDEIRKEHRFEDILAKSGKMQEIFRTIAKISEYKTTVLVTGESGSARRWWHRDSQRSKRHGPFVAVKCGAIRKTCWRASVGNRKGAFTAPSRIGAAFRRGDWWFALLDESRRAALSLQVKDARARGEKFRRWAITAICSGRAHHHGDAPDLTAETKAGRFREDMFYRLNVILIHCPHCVNGGRLPCYRHSWPATSRLARHPWARTKERGCLRIRLAATCASSQHDRARVVRARRWSRRRSAERGRSAGSRAEQLASASSAEKTMRIIEKS